MLWRNRRQEKNMPCKAFVTRTPIATRSDGVWVVLSFHAVFEYRGFAVFVFDEICEANSYPSSTSWPNFHLAQRKNPVTAQLAPEIHKTSEFDETWMNYLVGTGKKY